MIPEWDNKNFFKQHVKAMESFRRTHAHLAAGETEKPARGVSAPRPTYFHTQVDSGRTITDANGHVIVVAIEKVEMPDGSQN